MTATVGSTDQLVQVQACYGTSSTDTAPVCSTPSNVQLAVHAFGDSYTTTDIGPGTLVELTGDYQISATDADVASYLGSLTVGRTFDTLAPVNTEVAGARLGRKSIPVLVHSSRKHLSCRSQNISPFILGKPMNGFAKNVWDPEQLAGLSPSMADMLSRLGPMRKGSAQIRVELARTFEERGLSAGPVRAVLDAAFKGCPLALIIVTALDIVALGRGYGPDDECESIVIAKEWISEIHVHWGFRSRIRILLLDGPHNERELLFKGHFFTADAAEQWRLAALDIN